MMTNTILYSIVWGFCLTREMRKRSFVWESLSTVLVLLFALVYILLYNLNLNYIFQSREHFNLDIF